jgi:hypothetical protein
VAFHLMTSRVVLSSIELVSYLVLIQKNCLRLSGEVLIRFLHSKFTEPKNEITLSQYEYAKENLAEGRKELGLEVNAGKANDIFLSCHEI